MSQTEQAGSRKRSTKREKNQRDRKNFIAKQNTTSYLASIHPQRLLQKVTADPTLLSSCVTNKRSINPPDLTNLDPTNSAN
mmetsp:Transcript_1717/g.2788  ORF Transcript_1717/g.2788 Transcript_1717/m.2788 type:complete len:81 (-) Transcript_1717:4-246(-)